jgi:hypothetical protein
MLYIYVDQIPIIHMLIGKSFLSWFRNYKWLWIVSRIFQDSWKFAKILGISGNSGNPWNFKPLGLASVIQNLVPCSADFHEKCSRKVQTEKSQLTKFESPLGTASRVSERCLWVRPSLSRNFRGSCFFRGIRVSAIYFRELSRNSWQETWLFSCVTHHVYWNATKKQTSVAKHFATQFFFGVTDHMVTYVFFTCSSPGGCTWPSMDFHLPIWMPETSWKGNPRNHSPEKVTRCN